MIETTIITISIFAAFYFLVVRPLQKKADKEMKYYTHKQLREMEESATQTGYDEFGISITPYSVWRDED
jgi:preprotein translocase subunit YajC